MARPKSENRREAILEAAVRVIAAQGLAAPTAMIAQEAGVANGSLFTYFATKTELWNALYVALKTEMAEAATRGLQPSMEPKRALRQTWSGWLDWATQTPERRRTLALLSAADEITPLSRQQTGAAMAPVAELVERCRGNGAMHATGIGFVAALMNGVAEATIDFIIADPGHAQHYTDEGFEALWRIVA